MFLLGGVMLWRIPMLSIVAVLISGCVTAKNGADVASPSQKIGGPKPGQARIVVFREPAFGLIDPGVEVKLDGQLLGDLKAGTYAYTDRPAGQHQLSCESAAFPGVTRQAITVTAGRTHFFVAKPSERARTLTMTSAVGGLAGLAVGTAMTSGDSNPGPIDFVPLEEGAARRAIAELRLME
jgi:Protein of unknown function (DUF2846)